MVHGAWGREQRGESKERGGRRQKDYRLLIKNTYKIA